MSDESAPSTELPTYPNDTLAAALARYEIDFAPQQIQQLDSYCQLLWDWNTKLNLTRHTDYEKFVSRDVVDTLQFSQAIDPAERVLDVGTGGGVPGLLLAILRPDLEMAVCDSVIKRARVVGEIVAALGLPVAVHQSRAQDLLAHQRFHSLTVRAVAPLVKLLTWFAPWWGSFDRLLIVKGPAWVEERSAAREARLMAELRLRKLASWPLPGTQSESVLLEIRPSEG